MTILRLEQNIVIVNTFFLLKSSGYNACLEFVDFVVGAPFGLENPLCCDGLAVGGALSDCLGIVFEDGVDFALHYLAPSVLLDCGGVAEGLFK